MICKTCGAQYDDADRFCGTCGTPNPNFEINTTTPDVTESDGVNAEIEGKIGTVTEPAVSENSADFPDPTIVKPSVDKEKAFSSAQNYGEGLEQKSDFEPKNPSGNDDSFSSHSTSDTSEASDALNVSNTPNVQNTQNAQNTQSVQSTQNAPNRTNIPPNQAKPKPQKEKRVCSLSAVVICIIVILILSIALGVVSGLYLGEKRRNVGIRGGIILSDNSYSISQPYSENVEV